MKGSLELLLVNSKADPIVASRDGQRAGRHVTWCGHLRHSTTQAHSNGTRGMAQHGKACTLTGLGLEF